MGRKDDTAVSPAIGTILLVALTVVFVALAAAVVMGISGGLGDMKEVGLTLSPYGIDSEAERGISLTVHGGADAGDLVSLSASLNGPELVYRETGNSSVINPQVGPDYRFRAVESNVIVHTTRGNQNGINVDLETTEILPVSATEYYVTVTGTFRDGTEQVLLIQKVTLPAISGKGSASDASQYISVSPYSINDKYPGHGFIVKILNDSVRISNWNSVTFTAKIPDEGKVTLSKAAEIEQDKTYSHDISTVENGGKGWGATPYPNKEKYWGLYEITGTVSVPIQINGGKVQPITVEITVPSRVNIFEDKSRYAGEITYENEKLSLISIEGALSNPMYYFISSGDPVAAKSLISQKDLKDHSGQTLEAYVKVPIDPTEVWYRVASVLVSDLLKENS